MDEDTLDEYSTSEQSEDSDKVKKDLFLHPVEYHIV